MYFLSALTLVFVAISPALGIPPPDFGFPEAPNDTALVLTYPNNGSPLVVAEGQLFGVSSECLPSDECYPLTLRSSVSRAYRGRRSFTIRVDRKLQWLLCCHHGRSRCEIPSSPDLSIHLALATTRLNSCAAG